MHIALYTLAVLALAAGLAVFSYLDRIYRELGRVTSGRLHANLDIFEAEVEPRIRLSRRRAALSVTEQGFPDRLIEAFLIGDEDSLFHQPTLLSLAPARAAGGLTQATAAPMR